MNIRILWSWELPANLDGTVVVADVYAATTNIALFLARGVKKLFLVNEKSVLRLKQQYPKARIIGESLTLPFNFFQASNLPSKIDKVSLAGQTVCYMSINGTRVVGEVSKKGADKVLSVSFTNIDAVVWWLKQHQPKNLTLVPAGDGDTKVLEDEICITMLKDLIDGKTTAWEENITRADNFIRSYYVSKNFDPDLAIIFELNRYPVVPKCYQSAHGLLTVVDARAGQKGR
ncbi:2-phosphosulfolactate phosphatase [Candidatus Woesebacteria bacterium]|nr:2-phosphosulfolactate phosphatase [Candidatus Woesebacteria bacterium]